MPVRVWVLRLLGLVAALFSGTAPALASCGVIAGLPTTRQLAAVEQAAVEQDRVRLTFIGHASFLVETPEGATAITDYNGYNRPPGRAGHRHHEQRPLDPLPRRHPARVRHVLRGWDPGGGMAVHDVTGATCASSTCRPTCGSGAARAPGRTATRSSSSPRPTSASPISATSTTP
jgi:hypothetical protein